MDAIIVKWVGALITALKLGIASIFGRLMAGAGLALVNFQMVLPHVKQFVESRLSGAPLIVVQVIGACGIDIFIVLILSAIVARVGLKTITTTLTSVQALIAQQGGA